MNDIEKTIQFENAFKKISEKILLNRGIRSDYSAFETYLKDMGIPEGIIRSIYGKSGFESWDDFHATRNIDPQSEKVQTTLGRIRGATSAVNSVLDMYMKELENQLVPEGPENISPSIR